LSSSTSLSSPSYSLLPPPVHHHHHRLFSSSSDNDNDNDNDNDEGPVSKKLHELITEGGVQPDPHQLRAAKELDRIYRDLINYDNSNNNNEQNQQQAEEEQSSSTSFFGQFFGGGSTSDSDATTAIENSNIIKGAYTYGGVGCGKTFLMELFYHALDDNNNNHNWSNDKQIVHYHKFMLNVHQFMHTSRKERKEAGIEDGDLIDPVVDHILSSGKLLCLDEFQVTDVADAMILKELFSRLWKKGCVLVTTSNRPPRDLYLHGLQRDRFLPFIDLMEERCDVVSLMANETDYRMVISAQDDEDDEIEAKEEEETDTDPVNGSANGIDKQPQKKKKKKTRAKQAYFCGKDQKKVVQKLFYETTRGRPSNPTTLSTQGRKVKIPMACRPKSVCMFSFEDLCQKALGAADYLVIGQQFSTVIVYGIPKMTVNEINWLRRFITFVDSMYEWKVRLLLQTNADSVEEIFQVEDKESHQQDEVFAFDRTRSRLGEMSSTKYLSSQWLGVSDDDDANAVTTQLDLEPSMADQWFQLVGSNIRQQRNSNSNDESNDIDDFKQLFDEYDINKDGVLDKYEIKTMMTKAFGYEPVDLIVDEMIASIDTDENGVIDPEEFCVLLAQIKQHRQTV
jgi:protein AFG1